MIVAERDAFADYPATLKQSTLKPEILYHRSREHFAVRGAPETSARDVPVLTVTGDDGVTLTVYRGGPSIWRAWSGDPASIVPVYALSGTVMVVPTGRIFVRFRDGVVASTRATDLERAGYRLAQMLPYAPNAAWVEADDQQIASALGNISRLERLGDVVNVEPQLLAPRIAR